MVKRHQVFRIVRMDSYPDNICPASGDIYGMVGVVVKINIYDSLPWYDVYFPECRQHDTIGFLAGELEEVTEIERDIALAAHFSLENWL